MKIKITIIVLAIIFSFSKPLVVDSNKNLKTGYIEVTLCRQDDFHCLDGWTAKRNIVSPLDLRVWLNQLDRIYQPDLFWIK